MVYFFIFDRRKGRKQEEPLGLNYISRPYVSGRSVCSNEGGQSGEAKVSGLGRDVMLVTVIFSLAQLALLGKFVSKRGCCGLFVFIEFCFNPKEASLLLK